ncbi:MAG TPA: polysaccharide pyruvyl transferase family protein [Devosiaceae bacterium]|jgi:polysaccharide pyruvyl transferase WcaK-like protein
MRVIVTGVTRTGNLGGTAMLCAVEQVLGPHSEDFALCSILPRRDSAQVGPDHARIVDADYRYWMLVAAPLCLLFWPLRKVSFIRKLLSAMPLLADIAKADVIADLSGIAFVDGRGFPLLCYNVAIVLPGLFFDVPIYKLSQAMGPFEQKLNASLARWVFNRCRAVVARGAVSLSHLHALGIAKGIHRPDTSFALDIPNATRERARAQLAAKVEGEANHPLIICSPSAVVQERCADAGIDMAAVFSATFSQLAATGIRVALLPHSTDTGIRKNDDHEVARRIVAEGEKRGDKFVLLDPEGDPRLARALIGEADAFVATRFHSMIAALSQSVPTATVGWSHKYAEAAAPFGMGRFTVDYADLTMDRLVEMVTTLLRDKSSLRDSMLPVAETTRRSAIDGITLALAGRGS